MCNKHLLLSLKFVKIVERTVYLLKVFKMDGNKNLKLNPNQENQDNLETKEDNIVKPTDITLNDIILTIKEKQEEFSKMLSDYTNYYQKPLVDVIENDDNIVIKTDLPRIQKKDLEIAISEDSVDINAKFEEDIKNKDANYILRERSYGKISRSISLPAKVRIKEAKGTFEDSVLTIVLPKFKKKSLKLQVK